MPDLPAEEPAEAEVPWPDTTAGASARAAADPRLGGLANVVEWLAATGTVADRPRLLVLGAAGGSASGSASDAVAALAGSVGCPLTVLSAEGYAAGAAAADEAIDAGADLLLLAVPGAGDTAAIVTSLLTGAEPVKVLARGAAAADAETWMARAVAVRERRHELAHLHSDPVALLPALEDPVFAAATAVALHAAQRRTAVVLDGPAAAAAGLLAFETQPRAAQWWAAADAAGDPAGALAVERLGLRTLLGLGIDTADGTAALLALAVVRAAAQRGGMR